VVAHRVAREELAKYEPDATLDTLSAREVVATVVELTGTV
jgi:hypothetical protein